MKSFLAPARWSSSRSPLSLWRSRRRSTRRHSTRSGRRFACWAIRRGAAISRDPRAAGVDSQIRALAGSAPKLVEEFHGLAAQVFEDLTRNSGGDAARMTLARSQSDPSALAAQLSPATLERLRQLSVQMSDRRR